MQLWIYSAYIHALGAATFTLTWTCREHRAYNRQTLICLWATDIFTTTAITYIFSQTYKTTIPR